MVNGLDLGQDRLRRDPEGMASSEEVERPREVDDRPRWGMPHWRRGMALRADDHLDQAAHTKNVAAAGRVDHVRHGESQKVARVDGVGHFKALADGACGRRRPGCDTAQLVGGGS